MALTHEDVKQLEAPFAINDHKTRTVDGRVLFYLKEEAVCKRLSEVDPSWLHEPIGELIYRDNIVAARCKLTVCGVFRSGLGMAKLTTPKKSGGVKENDAEKAATTNALIRAARLFGVGRYLTEVPMQVTTLEELGKWLNNRTNERQNGKQPLPTPTIIEDISRNVTFKFVTERLYDGDKIRYELLAATGEKVAIYPNALGRLEELGYMAVTDWNKLKPDIQTELGIVIPAQVALVKKDGREYFEVVPGSIPTLRVEDIPF